MPQKTARKASVVKGVKSLAKTAKTKPLKPVAKVKFAPEPKVKPALELKAKPANGKSKTGTPGDPLQVSPVLKGVQKVAPKVPPKLPMKPIVAAPQVAPSLEKAKAALKKESKVANAAPVISKAKARKISIEIKAGEAASALAQKWVSLYKKADQIEAKPYNMKAIFEEKTAIVHKVLGWGYILANRNDRLEVLFKDGIKYLISNYKP